jgi:LuxR family maltose regulon positive regulatory protein
MNLLFASGHIPPGWLGPEEILRTKLYVPPVRANAVSRPALFRRLYAALNRKLTLVSAPPGFGKTTLLAAWIASLVGQTPVAWVSLDARDNDPVRFGLYLLAAMQSVTLSLGGLPAAPGLAQPVSLEAILHSLINQAAGLPGDLVFVLDDYHVITAPPVHDATAYLLEHLPPQMHLVLASRADAPLPLAQLRARDQLVELRSADLRFTLAETKAFFTQTMGLELPGPALAEIDARAEGWVGSLQLAALSLRERGGEAVPGFVHEFSGSHRYIVDYLAEQVLSRQPPEIQNFLLETAVLDRLCGPLCDAVTGTEGGTATLAALDRANLFLVPLDEQPTWYRYHALFGEFLRERLRQSAPARLPELHGRAARWLAQAGFGSEARPHAEAAGDAALTARLAGPADADALLDPLSEREVEVLRLVAAGHSNQTIARELVVAPSTVHSHVKNIYSKLDVHSRTQAVARAREIGLLV